MYKYPSLPQQLTILSDTREQYPLLFPHILETVHPHTCKPYRIPIHVKEATLKAGDYCCLEYPVLWGVERKGTQEELYKNLMTKDLARASRAFRRFVELYDNPVLLLEASPTSLLSKSPYTPDPNNFMCHLAIFLARFPGQVLWASQGRTAGQRVKLGTVLLHLLLGYIIQERGGTGTRSHDSTAGDSSPALTH